jgi:hypothetical protein
MMPAKITVERILRDENDDSGQSIRDWKIESECYGVMIRLKHGSGFILLRADDVDIFIADLRRAKEATLSLFAEAEISEIKK